MVFIILLALRSIPIALTYLEISDQQFALNQLGKPG